MLDAPLKHVFIILVLIILVYFKRDEIKSAFPVNKRMALTIHNDVRNGFVELVDLLVHNSEKNDLKTYISSIQSKSSSFREAKKESYAILYLNTITSYVDEQDTVFITYVDWKMAISDVAWNISKCLGDGWGKIELITFISYPKNISISSDGAFLEINKHLIDFGVQIAYVDDFSDGYHIIVYKYKNQKQIKSAIHKIGLPFMQNVTSI